MNKSKSLLKAFAVAALAMAGAAMLPSCTDNEEAAQEDWGSGTISGVVTDTGGDRIAAVSVTVEGSDASTTTSSDGTYSLDVKIKKTVVAKFTKTGYATVAMTVPFGLFSGGKVTLNPVLEVADAVITGRVLDASHGNVPFAGVTASIGSKELVTGADGVFSFTDLTIQDYTLTLRKTGAMTIIRQIGKDDFVNHKVDLGDIGMGGKELFRGKSLDDLQQQAPFLFMDEYRGGWGGGGLTDWSCTFMSAQWKQEGNIENQGEGMALRIRNDDPDKENNPVDQVFQDTYIYGIKDITDSNKYLTVNARTHQGPAHFGVVVVDMTSDDPEAIRLPETALKEYTDGFSSGDYLNFQYDLSAYVGKRIAIAIGTYRWATGDYWVQVPLKHITFAPEYVKGDDHLTGTEVPALPGWHLTLEQLGSMMPNPNRHFTAYTPDGVQVWGRDNWGPQYKAWMYECENHIASQWGFMYVNKDTEPFVGEGFTIKTRGGVDPDYELPESFWFSKFSISDANDHIAFRVRNFSSTDPTVFRVTAITLDGTAKALAPYENNAVSAEAVDNGCWKFIHEDGSKGSPDKYATFRYDLSEFSGKDIVLCIGVHKGETRDGEQKLVIYDVTLD